MLSLLFAICMIWFVGKFFVFEMCIRDRPGTDLWQRTYYHFRNDNAPVLQIETEEKFFSFMVKTDFKESHHRFDQCGVVMYLDSENWLKGSIEYELSLIHISLIRYRTGDWSRIIPGRCLCGSEIKRLDFVKRMDPLGSIREMDELLLSLIHI